MTNLFSKEELIELNERMLGRGAPVQEDGIGYNKADYGACATYFYGLSDSQLADLSKRLVKYCKTQLGLEKEDMKATHEHFAELAGQREYSREDGITLNITENGTLISFRYNDTFIEIIKNLPKQKRRWDGENKNWIIDNDIVIPTLNHLWTAGADVSGALEYAMQSKLITEHALAPKSEVKVKMQSEYALIKFEYNKDIVEAVRQIDKQDREYNSRFKFWAIKQEHLEALKDTLNDIATFKLI